MKISKTEEIMKRLREEGKSRFLDSKEDLEVIVKMNEHLEEFRREFIIKNNNSNINAAKVILF